MKKVLIFSGTTEGRILAKWLCEKNIACDVCVATEYGKTVMEQDPLCKVRSGRMSKEDMQALYQSENYLAVIDATHPYASAVTDTIIDSLNGQKIPYFRLERDTESNLSLEENNRQFLSYASMTECIAYLKQTEGNILLTTGSKELALFCEEESLKNRIFVRVLPVKESMDICYSLGLDAKQIIGMQGPFTQETNIALIHQYEIAHLVTKQSGTIGGMDEKLAAVSETGILCHMVHRPAQKYEIEFLGMNEVKAKLCELLGMETAVKEDVRLYITLAGIGMDGCKDLTETLRREIERADYIFGAQRMIEPFHPKKEKFPYYKKEEILECLEKIKAKEKNDENILILFSGDTGFYSGCEKLYRALIDEGYSSVKILPGISSIQALAARIGVFWQDATIVSAHGVEENVWKSRMSHALKAGEKVFFLTSGAEDATKICALIKMVCGKNGRVWIGKNLGSNNETVTNIDLNAIPDSLESGLYVGFALEDTKKNTVITPHCTDDAFLRENVPMTKEEIRAISICKLGLCKNSVVYDIGCGTGSISCEIAMLSPEIKVYAMDCNENAVALTKKNCEKHMLYNIEVIQGKAPEILETLPKADYAFIGGSSGNLLQILDALYRINPSMRVVVNAVSLETISNMQQAMSKFKLRDVDICQLSLAKAKELGAHQLMMANNPVYIYSFYFS